MVPIIGRILAVDFGARRIGLAICDERQSIVSPLRVLAGTGSLTRDAAAIAKAAEAEQVVAIVVGLPLNMDGSAGPQAHESQAFTAALQKIASIPIWMADERLTSFAADEWMSELNWSPEKRAKLRDALAARAILISFLKNGRDSFPVQRESPPPA